mmetsp:Transcript_68530/g.115202  ORF Transcript_68530/g.115202 Transcript_68530/m.115202 type:complete len:81 (+) Transcript_68530:182-424(+)
MGNSAPNEPHNAKAKQHYVLKKAAFNNLRLVDMSAGLLKMHFCNYSRKIHSVALVPIWTMQEQCFTHIRVTWPLKAGPHT